MREIGSRGNQFAVTSWGALCFCQEYRIRSIGLSCSGKASEIIIEKPAKDLIRVGNPNSERVSCMTRLPTVINGFILVTNTQDYLKSIPTLICRTKFWFRTLWEIFPKPNPQYWRFTYFCRYYRAFMFFKGVINVFLQIFFCYFLTFSKRFYSSLKYSIHIPSNYISEWSSAEC